MKKIGVTISAVQHRKLANGHKVRVKTGKGILLVNPEKFDILHNNFLRGKAKDITLTAEEIMVNRKLNPEFTNKLKTKTKSAVAKVAESVTPFKIPTEAEAESKVEPQAEPQVELQAIEDMFKKSVSTQLKGSGMHYLARAGIGAFLSNKASEALMGRGMTKKEQTDYTNANGQPFNHPDLEPVGRGGSLTGNFVSLDALQSKPYSENFHFRNMFPPTFTKHML